MLVVSVQEVQEVHQLPSFLQESREQVGFQQSNPQLLNDAHLCPAHVAPAIERTYKNLKMILSCPSSRSFAQFL